MAEQAKITPKRASQWPWSRRHIKYDPPTLLDQILESPIRTIISLIYSLVLMLRIAPFKPPRHKPSVKVVCISDTHSNKTTIPTGDVLIHAGDLTNSGSIQDIQAQIDWLASLPHREKIIIAGNHDTYFDPKTRSVADKGKRLNFRTIHYLENKAITLRFKGGRKLNFYGAGDVPYIGPEHAFQYQEDASPWANRIPQDTDVLITHTPPKYHLDLNLGCASLLTEIWRVKPRLHIFGHIHSGHGKESLFWDDTQSAYEDAMAKTGSGILSDAIPSAAWMDAVKVLFYGVRGILWDRLMVGPAGANGCLLVNAAIVWQSTTEVGNKATVVEI